MKYYIYTGDNARDIDVFIPDKSGRIIYYLFYQDENHIAMMSKHKTIHGFVTDLEFELPHDFEIKNDYTYEDVKNLIPMEIWL